MNTEWEFDFKGNQDEKLKFFSQKYSLEPGQNCKYVQAGLALYLWQRLINVGSKRIKVKNKQNSKCVRIFGVKCIFV